MGGGEKIWKNRLFLSGTKYRHHYVKAKVGVHRYQDGSLAIYYGPRQLARFTSAGQPEIQIAETVA